MENTRQQNVEVAENEMNLNEEYQEVETDEIFENEDLDFSDDFDFSLDDDEVVDEEEELLDEQGEEFPQEETEENIQSEKEPDAEQQEQKQEIEEATFDVNSLIPSVANVTNRFPEAGVASVVNSENGNRFVASSSLHEGLGKPPELQVGFLDDKIILGEFLGDNYSTYKLKKQDAKHIIYNTELVRQITEQCQLDFSNRTSITFHKATYQKLNGQTIAIISKK